MIRLGVIGHGRRMASFISKCLRPVSREEIRITGIVDPDEPGARSRLDEGDGEAVFFSSLDELVKKASIDAIMIGTRCNLHAHYAIQAAAYDVPLYVEKPVAITMEQAVGLESAFENAGCPTLVSFPLRASPLCRLVKEVLDGGAVGKKEHILARNYVPYGTVYWEREYRNYDITGGLFLQKATHDFDCMMHLMESPITQVAATAHYGGMFGGDKPEDLVCSECDEQDTCLESPQNRKRNASGGQTVDHPCVFSRACGTPETGMNEDTSSALVEFQSGAHGVYTQVFYARRDAAARGAVISGYMGTVDFDWYRNDLKRTRHHEPFTDTICAGAGASHFGGDEELSRNFLAMLKGIEKSQADITAGIRSVYTCLAARESARSGKFVKVRQIGE